jgi:hypothetical protein
MAATVSRTGRQMPTSISSHAIAKQRDLLIIGDGLWRRFAHFKLGAHLLQPRAQSYDLLLHLRNRRFLFRSLSF